MDVLSAPLPWKLDQEFHNLWRIIDGDGNVIFIGRPDVAALFYAAPDMLAALEAHRDWYAFEDGPGPMPWDKVGRGTDEGERLWRQWRHQCENLCHIAMTSLQAAIAKARGE